MATINNQLLQGAKGKIGDLVFSTRNGKTHVRSAPQRRSANNFSEKQMETIKNFKRYASYAKKVIADPELSKLYADNIPKGKAVYTMAIRDASRSPDISHIDADNYFGRPGDRIKVGAIDDFMVKSVSVQIMDVHGRLVEDGEATCAFINWEYIARVDNSEIKGCTIRVVARDIPGNEAVQQIII